MRIRSGAATVNGDECCSKPLSLLLGWEGAASRTIHEPGDPLSTMDIQTGRGLPPGSERFDIFSRGLVRKALFILNFETKQ